MVRGASDSDSDSRPYVNTFWDFCSGNHEARLTNDRLASYSCHCVGDLQLASDSEALSSGFSLKFSVTVTVTALTRIATSPGGHRQLLPLCHCDTVKLPMPSWQPTWL
jgi:hypothetical protein